MNKEHHKSKRCLFCLSIGLYFMGLLTSIILVGAAPLIQIKRPLILLAVSCAGAIPLKPQSFQLLQKILLLYFICMLNSQLTMDQIILTLQSNHFMLARSVIPLLLYAAAFVMFGISSRPAISLKHNIHWCRLWLITSAILILHMICLWLPLQSIYGFGTEHNADVLSRLVLYSACFVFTWNILSQPLIRYISTGCVIIHLLLMVM